MDAAAAQWIRDLRVADADIVLPICSEATIARVRDTVGQHAVDWAVRHARALANIDRATHSYGLDRGPTLAASQRLGAEAGYLRILECLYLGKVNPPLLGHEEHQYIADLVDRRIALAQLLTQVRHGHAYIVERLTDECRDLVPENDRFAQMQLVSRILFQYIDGLVTEVGPAFAEAERVWQGSLFAARADALERVLGGDDTVLGEASSRLGYQIEHRHHIAIAVYAEHAGDSDTPLIEAAKQTMAALRVAQTLIIPRGTVTLWAWGNAVRPPDVSPIPVQRGLTITVGRLGHGLAGFRSTHQQALEVHRIGQIYRGLGSPPRHFDDVELLSLLLADPDRAETFVRSVLGDLARDDSKTADLRMTLRSFLESRGPNETAAKLRVARNTVSYRLRRASELLGRPVGEQQLETWSALLLYDYTLKSSPTD